MQFDVRQRRVSALPLLKSDFVRFDQRQHGISIRQGVADTAGVDNPQVLDAEIAKCDVQLWSSTPGQVPRFAMPSPHFAKCEVDRDAWVADLAVVGPVYTPCTRAGTHIPSTVGAMLSVASTRVPVVYNGAKILRDHHGPW